MNKKQAQQEILRRLVEYETTTYLMYDNGDAENYVLKYHAGELSREELIRMITLDKDGNLLSEPVGYNRWCKYGEFGRIYKDAGSAVQRKYHEAFNQATEIVNCYDGE